MNRKSIVHAMYTASYSHHPKEDKQSRLLGTAFSCTTMINDKSDPLMNNTFNKEIDSPFGEWIRGLVIACNEGFNSHNKNYPGLKLTLKLYIFKKANSRGQSNQLSSIIRMVELFNTVKKYSTAQAELIVRQQTRRSKSCPEDMKQLVMSWIAQYNLLGKNQLVIQVEETSMCPELRTAMMICKGMVEDHNGKVIPVVRRKKQSGPQVDVVEEDFDDVFA